MTILQAYVKKQPLTGAPILTNKDGNPLSPWDIDVINLVYIDLGDDNVKIIKNAYGPTGKFSKLIFEEEFNVPDVTREELEINY